MIAPLGDFDKSSVRRGQAEPGRVVIRDINRLARNEVERLPCVVRERRRGGEDLLDERARIGDLVHADKSIHLGHFGGEFLGKALRHAPGDDQFLMRLFPAQPAVLMGFKDRADGFLLCRVDEGAGIDDQHIGCIRIGSDLHAALENAAQHHLRVGEIFGAAEADKADFDRSGGDRFQGFHGRGRVAANLADSRRFCVLIRRK